MSRRYDTPLTTLAIALIDRDAYNQAVGELTVHSADRDAVAELLSLTSGNCTDVVLGHRHFLGMLPCGLTLRIITEEVTR